MKTKEPNPFICQGYESPKYFCGREDETQKLKSALYNGRNITLISPRRIGKTGLIWHTFHQIRSENKDAICIYIDIFPTKNQSDFVRMLGEAVMNTAMSRGKQIGRKMLAVFSSLRPAVGIDPLTGAPNVSLNIMPSQSELTMRSIFKYLNSAQKDIFVAIDEFQQVANYPESGTEALLRSQIQFSRNVHFIFSGSRQHLMSEMFISPQRPFYQSTDIINLEPIDSEKYYSFASRFFDAKKWGFNKDLFTLLYNIFDGQTWYIQSILNRLYETGGSIKKEKQIYDAIHSVVESKIPQYESIIQIITDNQMLLLRALAKEGKVAEPLSKDFLKAHHLPSTSSVKTALDNLIDKELAYRTKKGYVVYDRFFGLWLKRL